MNCCDANGDCRQGRDCPARKPAIAPAHDDLPITMQDDFMNFDWCLRWIWTGMAWLGFFAMLAIIGFFFGYMS